MKKSVGLVLSFLLMFQLLFSAVPTLSFACSCIMPEPPKEALSKAAAVYTGTVESKVELKETYKITFAVDQAWKGVEGKTISVQTSKGGEAACGFNFQEGQKYIVYSHQGEDGQLHTSTCSRTAELQHATEDLKELGEGKAPVVAEPVHQAVVLQDTATVETEANQDMSWLATTIWIVIGGLFVVVLVIGLIRTMRKR